MIRLPLRKSRLPARTISMTATAKAIRLPQNSLTIVVFDMCLTSFAPTVPHQKARAQRPWSPGLARNGDGVGRTVVTDRQGDRGLTGPRGRLRRIPAGCTVTFAADMWGCTGVVRTLRGSAAAAAAQSYRGALFSVLVLTRRCEPPLDDEPASGDIHGLDPHEPGLPARLPREEREAHRADSFFDLPDFMGP